MSKVVKSPYAVKMTRKGKDVEVLVVSSTLHKNNENLQALVEAGFKVSDTLSRSKGGMNFGGNAQFYLYVTGTDANAKELDADVYGALVESEKTAKEEVKAEPKVETKAEVKADAEAPVVANPIPEEVEVKSTTRNTRKTKETAK